MITVTEYAREVLKNILVDMEAAPEEGLRLMPNPKGEFVLALDVLRSADQVVEHEGYNILIIGIEYFRSLQGKTVDCLQTEEGEVLLVR